MDYKLLFRSRTGRLGASAVALLAAALFVMIWYADGVVFALRTAPILVGLAFLTWWVWAWPALTLSNAGAQVRNQLYTYRFSWRALAETEVRYGLYLMVSPTGSVSPDREPGDLAGLTSIYVAGVPAQGGFKASRQRQAASPPPITAADGQTQVLMVAPSAAARIVDEQQLKMLSDDHPADGGEVPSGAGTYRKTFNWVPATILVGTAILAALLWPYSGYGF